MLSHTEIAALVSTLPAEMITRFVRINAQMSIISDANANLGYRNDVIQAMEDAVSAEFEEVFTAALAAFPTIADEQPTADGEFLNGENLQRYLSQL